MKNQTKEADRDNQNQSETKIIHDIPDPKGRYDQQIDADIEGDIYKSIFNCFYMSL